MHAMNFILSPAAAFGFEYTEGVGAGSSWERLVALSLNLGLAAAGVCHCDLSKSAQCGAFWTPVLLGTVFVAGSK